MKEPIDVLRYALAAVWTELENDQPNIEDCRTIINEAMGMTNTWCKGKVPRNETGLESWREFLGR